MTASISWPESDLGLPLTETYEIAYTSRVVGSDLDIDPVIFLQCGHFYSMSTLDGMMEIGEFYCNGYHQL